VGRRARVARTSRNAARSRRSPSSARPFPRCLAAPITGKPATGFDRLFASEGEIVGEVVESGLTVRAARDFHGLGIEAPVDPKSQFGTASMTDLQ
jgi:hypothetical protein